MLITPLYQARASIWKLLALLIISTSSFNTYAQNVDPHAPPVVLTGSLGLQLVGYSTTRPIPSRTPFSYSFLGNLNLSLYNVVQLPFSFIYSEQERHIAQPFNQFGISPSYKWIKLHLGYRNITYSPYTLNGYTFLGGGIELTPHKFRFSCIVGRFDRPLTGVPAIDSVKPVFRRIGYAMRIGVGTEMDHIDFIMFRAKDQFNTLQPIDTTLNRPAENLVLGLNLKEHLSKKIYFEGDYAFSMYTDNTKATPLSETIDNSSFHIPSLGGVFTPYTNTQYYSAIDAGIGYKEKYYAFKIIYKRIAPGYQTLGSYPISSDLENVTLNPSFNLWKNKVNASGSIGYQHDNLLQTKSVTSDRLIGSANININPKPIYGLSFQFNNYTTNQAPGLKVINDTLRLAQVSRSFSVMPRYMLQRKKAIHNWMIVYMLQTLTDHNPFTQKYAEYQTRNVNAIYNLSFINSGIGANLSYNNSHTSTYYGNNDYQGVTLGGTKSFLHNALGTSLNFTYNATEFNQQSSGHVINIQGTVNYRFKKHTLNFSLYFIQDHSTIDTRPSFHELTSTLGYNYNF